MWRYVSYPLTMLAGVNGILIASLQACHHLFGYTMPTDGMSATLIVGSIVALASGFIQSYTAVEIAKDRNEKQDSWAHSEKSKAAEFERQRHQAADEDKYKEADAIRKEEAKRKEFERGWRLKMETLAGIPDPDLMTGPADQGETSSTTGEKVKD